MRIKSSPTLAIPVRFRKALKAASSLAALAVLASTLGGCATLLRGRYTGDGFFPTKGGINIVTDSTDQNAKVEIDGKEAQGKMIYEGSRTGSPFYVRRFPVEKSSDSLRVKVTTARGSAVTVVARESEYGWWLVGGLWTFVDLFTGALHSYDDVVVVDVAAPQ